MAAGIEWTAVAGRLALSILLGGVIGIEREIHGKSAGLRTHMLVALGATLFTIISFMLPVLLHESGAESTRIAAQIITGVGFLGAGTILQSRGSVHGLTTAASIWLVAAIGMAAGAGFFTGALETTLYGVIVLVLVHYLESFMIRRRGIREIVEARMVGEADLQWLEQLARQIGLREYRFRMAREGEVSRIRVEGLFRPGVLEELLHALRQRGAVQKLMVVRP